MTKSQPLVARDLMTTTLLSVRPNMGMQELVDFLRENRIHGALVQEGERIVGVVSLTDVIFHLSEEADEGAPFWRYYPESDHPDRFEMVPEGMEDVTVDDLMTPKVITCDVMTPVGEVAARMLADGIHRVVVTDGGAAKGLISATDLLKAVTEYEKALGTSSAAAT